MFESSTDLKERNIGQEESGKPPNRNQILRESTGNPVAGLCLGGISALQFISKLDFRRKIGTLFFGFD